jgi:hypothetical protein
MRTNTHPTPLPTPTHSHYHSGYHYQGKGGTQDGCYRSFGQLDAVTVDGLLEIGRHLKNYLKAEYVFSVLDSFLPPKSWQLSYK